jgi:transposase
MGKPLSEDLRSHLVAAVAGGMSRHAAAERFGVAAASAVRWVLHGAPRAQWPPSPRAVTCGRIASRPIARSS